MQKRQAFDQAVLAAIEGSVMGTTMTEMGTLVVNEVGKLAATLGADASQKTTDAMTTQGVLGLCDRIIRVQTPHKMLLPRFRREKSMARTCAVENRHASFGRYGDV